MQKTRAAWADEVSTTFWEKRFVESVPAFNTARYAVDVKEVVEPHVVSVISKRPLVRQHCVRFRGSPFKTRQAVEL